MASKISTLPGESVYRTLVFARAVEVVSKQTQLRWVENYESEQCVPKPCSPWKDEWGETHGLVIKSDYHQ